MIETAVKGPGGEKREREVGKEKSEGPRDIEF